MGQIHVKLVICQFLKRVSRIFFPSLQNFSASSWCHSLLPAPSVSLLLLLFCSFLAACFQLFAPVLIKRCQTPRCGSASVVLGLVLLESTEAAASLSRSQVCFTPPSLGAFFLSFLLKEPAEGGSKIITPFRFVALDNLYHNCCVKTYFVPSCNLQCVRTVHKTLRAK